MTSDIRFEKGYYQSLLDNGQLVDLCLDEDQMSPQGEKFDSSDPVMTFVRKLLTLFPCRY